MLCPHCQTPSTDVTNSRPHKKHSSVWRRRHCMHCGLVFTTRETPLVAQQVSRDDGTSTPFSLSRLTVSIARSFPHDPRYGDLVALDLAQTISIALQSSQEEMIPLEKLVSMTRATLTRFDPKAGLAYALQHNLAV